MTTTSISVLEALHGDDPGLEDRREQVARIARELEHAWAGDVLAWAARTIPRFAVTSSFGADSAVLLHLLSTVAPHVPVIFLDTGLHFEATITFREELAERLGLRVVDVRPARSVAAQATDEGDRLWERDPDRCCSLRKTIPLRDTMQRFDGWATGVRRSQTPERATQPIVEVRRAGGRHVTKVAPLARWSEAEVATYLEVHELPRHPLVDDGYASIGCAPCTVRVAPGEDARAGRWSAFDSKTECGIHLPGDDRP
ncbi:MAG: phosphoadenylyl-sulfate reductase [Nitriliruptor sp.]